jgi:hypothetical protein
MTRPEHEDERPPIVPMWRPISLFIGALSLLVAVPWTVGKFRSRW